MLLDQATGRRNPTIALNRIVAQAMTEGEERALAALADLARAHPDLPRVRSVRAHLLERAGRVEEAVAAYREAAATTLNAAERQYLVQRRHRLETGGATEGASSNQDTPGRTRIPDPDSRPVRTML